MSFSETLHFDEIRYRIERLALPYDTLQTELVELIKSVTNHRIGLTYSLLGVIATSGLSLLGTAYTGRQLSIMNQKIEILKEILRQRSNEGFSPQEINELFRTETNNVKDEPWSQSPPSGVNAGSISSESEESVAVPAPKPGSRLVGTNTKSSSTVPLPIQPTQYSSDFEPAIHTQFRNASISTTINERRSQGPGNPVPELAFDEDRYREQLRQESQISLDQKLADVFAEKKRLMRNMQDSMSSEQRQTMERQCSIVDSKRAILLERIYQKTEFDEGDYRIQLQDLPLLSLQAVLRQLQEELTGLTVDAHSSLPPMMKKKKKEEIEVITVKQRIVEELIEQRSTAKRSRGQRPSIEVDAVFNEAQYLSQVRFHSVESLRKEHDALHQRSVQLIREMRASLSPHRRGAVEKELSIIGKKRTILNKLIEEAGQVVIDPRSELPASSSVKRARPREEQTLISLLDSSEEVVDVNTGSNSHRHSLNTVIGGTVDGPSTEIFDDDFVQKRPDPSSDAYY
ncbi:hypothetical protein FRC17_004525, partial [Serendipita sp. 399]